MGLLRPQDAASPKNVGRTLFEVVSHEVVGRSNRDRIAADRYASPKMIVRSAVARHEPSLLRPYRAAPEKNVS
jgi:hypothetical protein